MKNQIKVLGIILFLLFPMLFFISCNPSDKNTTKNTHSVDTVVIKQMQFFPADLNVKIGDTVVWINNDMVPHTVKESEAQGFYSDTINVGKSWKTEVKDSASYICSIHPTMVGKLVLK